MSAVRFPVLSSVLALTLEPRGILDAVGPWATVVLILIIFAESGLLIGFFLPGDSLLVTAGILAAQGSLNIWVILVGCFIAAVAGDQVGYMFGSKVGPALFRRPDSRIFKQKYVHRTKEFFDRHGPKTIVIARFVPIVRTFAPILAGVGEMRYRTFVRFNVVGALLWAVGVTLIGYFLGQTIGPETIDKYLLPIIALIVALSLIPPLVEWVRHRRARAAEAPVGPLSAAEAEEEAHELEELLHED